MARPRPKTLKVYYDRARGLLEAHRRAWQIPETFRERVQLTEQTRLSFDEQFRGRRRVLIFPRAVERRRRGRR